MNQNIFANRVRTASDTEDLALQQNQHMLGSFLTILQSHGALPIFIPQSVGSPDLRRSPYPNIGSRHNALQPLNRGYTQICQMAGVCVIIDPTPTMNTWGNEYFRDAVHLNDAGAAELGRLVAEQMALNPLVQQRYAANRNRTRPLPTSIQVLQKSLPESRLVLDMLSLERIDAINSAGFGALEGPYPELNLPHKIRWMTQPTAQVRFNNAGTDPIAATLRLNVQTMTMPQQLRISLNGNEILQYASAKSNTWQNLRSQKMTVRPGENRLEFEAMNPGRSDNPGFRSKRITASD